MSQRVQEHEQGTRTRAAIPEGVIDALEAVLDYLWRDELNDYTERREPERRGHIFEELRAVRCWLDATEAER